MAINITIFRDSAPTAIIPIEMVDYLFDVNDRQDDYSFQLLDGFQIAPDKYAFGITLPGNIFRYFRTLPISASLEQFKKVISEILDDRYSFEGETIKDTASAGAPATSIIDIPLSDSKAGGLLSLFELPKWLDDLLGKLGLNANTPWWIWAGIATVAAFKLQAKDSNKWLWGAIAAVAAWVLLNRITKPKN